MMLQRCFQECGKPPSLPPLNLEGKQGRAGTKHLFLHQRCIRMSPAWPG